MDVLTFETFWTLNNEIIKRVTSSWSIFTQPIFCLGADSVTGSVSHNHDIPCTGTHSSSRQIHFVWFSFFSPNFSTGATYSLLYSRVLNMVFFHLFLDLAVSVGLFSNCGSMLMPHFLLLRISWRAVSSSIFLGISQHVIILQKHLVIFFFFVQCFCGS